MTFGAITLRDDAVNQLTSIQALIDAVNAGSATSDEAESAQAAVGYIQTDLAGINSTATKPLMSPTMAIFVGLGVGLTLAGIAYALTTKAGR